MIALRFYGCSFFKYFEMCFSWLIHLLDKPFFCSKVQGKTHDGLLSWKFSSSGQSIVWSAQIKDGSMLTVRAMQSMHKNMHFFTITILNNGFFIHQFYWINKKLQKLYLRRLKLQLTVCAVQRFFFHYGAANTCFALNWKHIGMSEYEKNRFIAFSVGWLWCGCSRLYINRNCTGAWKRASDCRNGWACWSNGSGAAGGCFRSGRCSHTVCASGWTACCPAVIYVEAFELCRRLKSLILKRRI